MHDHEVRETPPKSPKPSVQRAVAPGGDLLSLQRLAGNSAVAQHVQRADVEIDELSSNVRSVDSGAAMAPDTQKMIAGVVHDTAKAAGGPGEAGESTESGGPTEASQPTESSESTGASGPSTLPPGGHATMEEEPG